MKKCTFSILVLGMIFVTTVEAQQTATGPKGQKAAKMVKPFKRWSVDVLAGAAVPVGAFGSLDHQFPGGGPIHAGGLAEASGTYQVNRSFGILLLASGQLNKGNGIDYSAPPQPLPPGTLPGDEQVQAAGPRQYWKIVRLMTGAEYTLTLDRKKGIDLLFRGLGGVQKTKPATYNQYFDNGEESISYPRFGLPWSFSYQFDAGLKWQQTRRIAFLTYVGYNGSEPSKELTYLKVSSQGVWTYYPVKAKIPTGSLLFRAGIEIGL